MFIHKCPNIDIHQDTRISPVTNNVKWSNYGLQLHLTIIIDNLSCLEKMLIFMFTLLKYMYKRARSYKLKINIHFVKCVNIISHISQIVYFVFLIRIRIPFCKTINVNNLTLLQGVRSPLRTNNCVEKAYVCLWWMIKYNCIMPCIYFKFKVTQVCSNQKCIQKRSNEGYGNWNVAEPNNNNTKQC